MKAIILAGGLGTHLSEETVLRPKPMAEIGKQILRHILNIYSRYGINDFIICSGYKSSVIKEHFSNHYLHNGDIPFDASNDTSSIVKCASESWRLTVVDTGKHTLTGGR